MAARHQTPMSVTWAASRPTVSGASSFRRTNFPRSRASTCRVSRASQARASSRPWAARAATRSRATPTAAGEMAGPRCSRVLRASTALRTRLRPIVYMSRNKTPTPCASSGPRRSMASSPCLPARAASRRASAQTFSTAGPPLRHFSRRHGASRWRTAEPCSLARARAAACAPCRPRASSGRLRACSPGRSPTLRAARRPMRPRRALRWGFTSSRRAASRWTRVARCLSPTQGFTRCTRCTLMEAQSSPRAGPASPATSTRRTPASASSRRPRAWLSIVMGAS